MQDAFLPQRSMKGEGAGGGPPPRGTRYFASAIAFTNGAIGTLLRQKLPPRPAS